MKIYEAGIDKYSLKGIIARNLLLIIWVVIGTVACWLLNPIIGWLYLGFAILMVGIVLKKLNCTNCYYYDKWCCMGWGKFSALLFKKGDMGKFSTSIGMKLAPLTYGALTVIPLILILILIFKNFSLLKLIILIFLFIISFYNGIIIRKKACTLCKMRLICLGSAARYPKQ